MVFFFHCDYYWFRAWCVGWINRAYVWWLRKSAPFNGTLFINLLNINIHHGSIIYQPLRIEFVMTNYEGYIHFAIFIFPPNECDTLECLQVRQRENRNFLWHTNSCNIWTNGWMVGWLVGWQAECALDAPHSIYIWVKCLQQCKERL